MKLDNLYERSPVLIQHLATAAYGLKMRLIRRGSVYRRTRRELATGERLSPAEIREQQNQRLGKLIRHATAQTRYYAELFEKIGIKPDSIRSAEDLQRLPLLEKETLFERGEDLVARGVPARRYHTSGTSGTTLAIPIDDASRQRNYAFFSRALSWAGVENASSATFAGRPIVPSGEERPSSVWRWNPAMKNRLFSSYHLSDINARAYSEALTSWKPGYLDSYPSAAATLSRLIREQGLDAPQLKAVITSSETLLDHQRADISDVFGAPCFDQYGSTEQAAYVSQCENGSYHAHPEYGILEIIDPSGSPSRPGSVGELVCTSFSNDALPLIRYRIGDTARATEAGCACGRAFPVLDQIEGRLDDMLVTPDGRRVGRLDPVFKGRLTVKEAQVVQVSQHEVVVRIVPSPSYEESDGEAIIREMQRRLSPEMIIRTERVEAIERTRNGKFRSVLNQMGSDA